jgi:hypothetical protein
MTRLPAPAAAVLCVLAGMWSPGCGPDGGARLCDAIARRDLAGVRRVLSEHAIEVSTAQKGCVPAAAVLGVARARDTALTGIGIELVKAGLAPDVSWMPPTGGPRTYAVEAAAANGNIELVRALLAVGLDVTRPEARRAVLWASANGHLPVVTLLVREGVDIDPADDGDSPAARAQANGHTEVVRFLDDTVAARNAPRP